MSFLRLSREYMREGYTEIDNVFFTGYLPEADSLDVKIYLYGLWLAGIDRKLLARMQKRVGPPVLQPTYDFFKREEAENAFFYTPYMVYNYTPETLQMYNTKTPYTELAYWGTLFANSEKEESNVRVMTTQNILPELNITLEYDRFGGNGMLQNEDTDNRTFVAAANYLGKRYFMNAGYIFNRIKKSENGGIVDNFWIRDTTVDAREISVRPLSLAKTSGPTY